MQTVTYKRLVAAFCLCLTTSAAVYGDLAAFGDNYQALRDEVRGNNVSQAVIGRIKQLLTLTGDVDEKISASRLLADAYNKRKEYANAADTYLQCFRLEAKRDRRDRAQRVYEAARDRLNCIAKIKPFSAENLQRAAEESLAWKSGEQYSLKQKLDLVNVVVSAMGRARRKGEAVAYVESLLTRNRLGQEGHLPIMMTLAEQAARAELYEKEEQVCKRILADSSATPSQRGAIMLRQARTLERDKHLPEALTRAEDALEEFDKGVETGLDLGWQTVDSIRWAGIFSRDVMLDSSKAILFFNKMLTYTDGDYWMVPARQELANTYRKLGEFDKAQAEYDTIVKTSDKYHTKILLPLAEMLYYDMGRTEDGTSLFEKALETEAIRTKERYNALFKLTDHLRMRGDKKIALQWYRRYAPMPNAADADSTRYLARAYYNMGQLYVSLGQHQEAKDILRRAMNLEGGDMRFRVMARNTLEDMLYFE